MASTIQLVTECKMTSSSVTAESKFLGHVYHTTQHQEVAEPGEWRGEDNRQWE